MFYFSYSFIILFRKIFTRNHYDLPNSLPQPNSALKNDLDTYYRNTHCQYQQLPYGHRTRSEINLFQDSPARMHLSPRYESRLVNGSGAPISTNPVWTAASSSVTGSQPNLLVDHGPLYRVHHRRLYMPNEPRMTSAPLQHPRFANYTTNKPAASTQLLGNQRQWNAPIQSPPLSTSQSNRKHNSQFEYFDTNEFILRASNGQLSNSSQSSNRPLTDKSRPSSINVNSHSHTMLDVYY